MKPKIYITLTIISLFVLAGSSFWLLKYWHEDKKVQSEFNSLKEKTEKVTENKIPSERKYEELFKTNEDTVGWLSIKGTVINYPAMKSPQGKPDFYLNHGSDKKESTHGVPYIADHCSLNSDNIIIYGHHMRTGTMFGSLSSYENEDYYQNHKRIQFDTKEGYGTYQIFAVFKTTVSDEDSRSFHYYLFTDAFDDKEYNNYIKKCKNLSFYDTGITPQYGDKLITLSTCDYTKKDGRFVVTAVKINE